MHCPNHDTAPHCTALCCTDRKVRDAKFAFEAAMDAGLNFFDTAGEWPSGIAQHDDDATSNTAGGLESSLVQGGGMSDSTGEFVATATALCMVDST